MWVHKMICTLYTNFSDNRVLDKRITQIAEISGKIKGDCLTTAPTIIIQNRDMTNINYIYINDFNRYYYISEIKVMTGGVIELSCKVDVLMSFKTEIKQLKVNVLRYENTSPTFLADTRIPLYSDTVQKVIEFPDNIFNLDNPIETDKNFLLSISGGSL